MADPIIAASEDLLKEMEAASTIEVHWRTFCQNNKDRIIKTLSDLLDYARTA